MRLFFYLSATYDNTWSFYYGKSKLLVTSLCSMVRVAVLFRKSSESADSLPRSVLIGCQFLLASSASHF